MKSRSDEKIIWSSYRSWKSYYIWMIFVFIWFLLSSIFSVFFFIFIISLIVIVLDRFGSRYYITNKKVYSVYNFHVGFKKSSLPLRKIESVDMERDLWGELFGYGDINIGVIGETKVTFKAVREPTKVVNTLKRRTGNR